jgi:hypothetical protein
MSEEKQKDMYPVFDTLDRLYREGYAINKLSSEDTFYLVDSSGEIAMTGNTFRDLCVNIVLEGL